MAYTTINKSTDHFNTKIYTGNSSSPRTITGVGFQPDFTWIKPRNLAYSHTLVDAVRGASGNGALSGTLISNSTGAPEGDTNSDGTITAFTSDGFTLTAGSSGSGRTNGSYNYASWNWKANGAGSSNSDGSITSTVSANTTAGFSIVKYTGTGSNATIGHGLGVAPKFILVKNLTDARSWGGYHASLGATKGIDLDGNGAAGTASSYWNDTEPTTTVFSIGTANNTGAAQTYVAYCFAEKTGFSKFGSYIGNGNADGVFIYTGFKPAFVVTKKATGSADNWILLDNKRDTAPNPQKLALFANLNNVEAGDYLTDFLSNGFKIRSATGSLNNDNSTYIYMAFAEAPLVGSNNVPCTAR